MVVPDERSKLLPAPDTPEAAPAWTREHLLVIVLCSYPGFMWGLFYTVIVPLLPLYARSYKFTELGQGVVLASLQLGWFLGVPFVHQVPVQPHMKVYVGLIAYIAASSLVAWHPSLWTLLVSRAVEGFGSCMLMTLMTSVLVREIPSSMQGRAIGLKACLVKLGLFTGPLVGGLLYPYGGIRLPMLVITVMGVLGLVAYVIWLPRSWFSGFEARFAADESQGASILSKFSPFLQHPMIRSLLSVHFLSWSLVGWMFMAVPQYFIDKVHVSAFRTSIFWLVCDLAQILSALLGGQFADTAKPWAVLFGGISLQRAFQLALVVATTFAPKEVWMFLALTIAIFAIGSTDGGLLGASYLKLFTSLEREMLNPERSLASKHRFEELLTLKEIACACALTLGPLLAGTVYRTLGFGTALLVLVSISLISDSWTAHVTQELRSL